MLWGATHVPLAWKLVFHVVPDLGANDLTNFAFLAIRGGKPIRESWLIGSRMPTELFLHTAPRQHPRDDGVWPGSLSAPDELPPEASAVVPFSRVGAEQVPDAVESIRVWLVDEDGQNASLDIVLTDAADTIAALRTDGKQVFGHCAEPHRLSRCALLCAALQHRTRSGVVGCHHRAPALRPRAVPSRGAGADHPELTGDVCTEPLPAGGLSRSMSWPTPSNNQLFLHTPPRGAICQLLQ